MTLFVKRLAKSENGFTKEEFSMFKHENEDSSGLYCEKLNVSINGNHILKDVSLKIPKNKI